MNAQLNYMTAKQRSAELQRAGDQVRAREAHLGRRRLSDPHPVTSVSALEAERAGVRAR